MVIAKVDRAIVQDIDHPVVVHMTELDTTDVSVFVWLIDLT